MLEGSLLGVTSFLLFINDVSKIYILSKQFCRWYHMLLPYSEKQLNEENCFASFNSSKTKLVSFHLHWSDHETFSICEERLYSQWSSMLWTPTESQVHFRPELKRSYKRSNALSEALSLNVYWFNSDLKWNTIQYDIRYNTKDSRKWSTHSVAPRSTWFLLPFLIFTWIRLKHKQSMALISGLELLNPLFLALMNFKIFYTFLCVWRGYSPFCICFANDASLQSLSLLYRYVQYSDELHSSVRLIQTFTIRVHYNTFNDSNNPYGPRDPNVRRQFHSHSFFPLTSTLWNRLPPGCFPVR